MPVRADLKEVESLISRLILIGEEYRTKDKLWSHLKNNEDWGRCIWPINDPLKKGKIERIYSNGRNMALSMSHDLVSINYDFTSYPTLTKIVEYFKTTCIYKDLESIIQAAKDAHDSLELNCWSFDQMVSTYREQMELEEVIRNTLNLLTESNLYKQENGLPMEKETPNISIGNITNSNVALSSENTDQSVVINEAVFDELLEAIKSSDIEHKEPIITAIEEMQDSHILGGIGESYKKFISVAANHMTIVAPFLPALTALL
jgi:hypothetical protein